MRKLLTILIFLLIPVFLISGCNDSTVIRNDDFAQVFLQPNKFIDREVEITGKITLEPKQKKDYALLSIAPNPADSSKFVEVITEEKVVFAKGGFIRVNGFISDDNPTITSNKLTKISPQRVLAPTVHQETVEQTIDESGFKVTLNKLEFADTETRVFIDIENETNKDVHFYADHAQAFQYEGEQKIRLKLQKNWVAEYTELPLITEAESSTSGIIVFQPLNYALESAQFIFEGFSEERYVNPFEFELEW